MHEKIRARHGRLDPVIEEQLERCLHFALARFGDRIRHISALPEDLNEPRGDENQRCRIEVGLVPSGTITAEATDAEVAPAIGHAADRVARRVRDALDRKRTMRMRTGSPPSENDAPPQNL